MIQPDLPAQAGPQSTLPGVALRWAYILPEGWLSSLQAACARALCSGRTSVFQLLPIVSCPIRPSHTPALGLLRNQCSAEPPWAVLLLLLLKVSERLAAPGRPGSFIPAAHKVLICFLHQSGRLWQTPSTVG